MEIWQKSSHSHWGPGSEVIIKYLEAAFGQVNNFPLTWTNHFPASPLPPNQKQCAFLIDFILSATYRSKKFLKHYRFLYSYISFIFLDDTILWHIFYHCMHLSYFRLFCLYLISLTDYSLPVNRNQDLEFCISPPMLI